MKMTMGQLRRIIRETIEEETRHSVNEGFMDSVKGLFGGGTKGARSTFIKNINDLLGNKSIAGMESEDWTRLEEHLNKTIGSKATNQLKPLLDANRGWPSTSAFLQTVIQAVQEFTKKLMSSDDSYNDIFTDSADELKKGSKSQIMSALRLMLEENSDMFIETFKSLPGAKAFLKRKDEDDEEWRDAKKKWDEKDRFRRASERFEKDQEERALKAGQENRREYAHQEEEKRRAASHLRAFDDALERRKDGRPERLGGSPR